LKFIGRFEELLGTGRGPNFETVIVLPVLGSIHGCHETVAGIQLKPTINYWISIQDIKTHSIFKKKSSLIDKTEINQDLKTM